MITGTQEGGMDPTDPIGIQAIDLGVFVARLNWHNANVVLAQSLVLICIGIHANGVPQ